MISTKPESLNTMYMFDRPYHSIQCSLPMCSQCIQGVDTQNAMFHHVCQYNYSVNHMLIKTVPGRAVKPWKLNECSNIATLPTIIIKLSKKKQNLDIVLLRLAKPQVDCHSRSFSWLKTLNLFSRSRQLVIADCSWLQLARRRYAAHLVYIFLYMFLTLYYIFNI
jgi:hypothetical protein